MCSGNDKVMSAINRNSMLRRFAPPVQAWYEARVAKRKAKKAGTTEAAPSNTTPTK